jgi:hypothetical protein
VDAIAKTSKGITALVRGGKRVHQNCYIHISLLHEQPAAVQRVVENGRRLARIDDQDFNVIRFSQKQQIGFLRYGQFFDDPFPKLESACLVDTIGKKVRRTDFTARDNPPILHRKELLLATEHPNRSQLSALTEVLEKKGLFGNDHRIGYKKQWEDIHELALSVRSHTPVRTRGSASSMTTSVTTSMKSESGFLNTRHDTESGDTSAARQSVARNRWKIGRPDPVARALQLPKCFATARSVWSLLSLYLPRASSAVWVIEFPYCFA